MEWSGDTLPSLATAIHGRVEAPPNLDLNVPVVADNAGLVAPEHQSGGGTSRIQISQTTVLFTHDTDARYYPQDSYIMTDTYQQLRTNPKIFTTNCNQVTRKSF